MRLVWHELFLQTKFLLQSESALGALLLEIFHMSLTARYHGQKAAAGVVVLSILLKMRGQLLNTLCKYGNLHFRRAGVLVVDSNLLDELLFLGL